MQDLFLRIAGTVPESIVDGPGIRFTIFTQGCPHNCFGCHNPQTHDFSAGELVSLDDLLEKMKGNPLIDGVTFSGGEPFCQARELYYIATQVKKLGLNILAYTGFTFEYLVENSSDENFYKELLSVTDILIDGKFEIEKKSYSLKFRGSSNQRIISVKESLEQNKVVEITL